MPMLLKLFNCINLISGLILLSAGVFMFATFNSGWDSVVPINAVIAAVVAGAAMMLTSFLGCCCLAPGNSKFFIFIYAFLCAAILAALGFAAIQTLNYSNLVTNQKNLISADLITPDSVFLNNAVFSIYASCCSGCPAQANCNNAEPYFQNIVTANCVGQNCQFVSTCGRGQDNCYTKSNLVPAEKFDQAICTLLSNIPATDGKPIVGLVSSGSCGNGDPKTFETNMNDFMGQTTFFLGIAFAVLAGIQGLVVLIGLYTLLCTSSSSDPYKAAEY